MFWNWAEETTTTTGTGALTTSAVSGKPRLSDVVPVGELVSYAILDDTTGNPIEAGIGTLTGVGALSRSLVRATYVSGTYTGSAATAVSLAAGTKRVIATPIAGTFCGAAPAQNTAAAQRAIFSTHSEFNSGDFRALGASNEVHYMPFEMIFGCEVDAMLCNVTAAGATNVRMGVYLVGTDGKPSTKIIETADVSVATTGTKTGTFTRRYLPPGWYYVAIASKGVTASVRAYGAGTEAKVYRSTPLGMANYDSNYVLATETLAGGWSALPATANGTLAYAAVTSDFAPRLGLRPA